VALRWRRAGGRIERGVVHHDHYQIWLLDLQDRCFFDHLLLDHVHDQTAHAIHNHDDNDPSPGEGPHRRHRRAGDHDPAGQCHCPDRGGSR
jgi:hypothetical protein